MKLYVSGPMTGLPEYNYPAFRDAERLLAARGFEVVSPARGMVDGWGWIDYMRRALDDVAGCDAVATLSGYESSRGARIEVLLAEGRGLRVAPLSEWLA